MHAAHRVRDQYPDGQLFVDLRGHEAEALSPGEVLRRFLHALGEPDQRAARYRSLLSD